MRSAERRMNIPHSAFYTPHSKGDGHGDLRAVPWLVGDGELSSDGLQPLAHIAQPISSGANGSEVKPDAVVRARLLRSQGNLSGRGRLRQDLSERPSYPPRGIIIATGEQYPPGQSLLARTLLLEFDHFTVNLETLTEAQRTAGVLPNAMAGFI